MTPGARLSAAIAVLDKALSGASVEQSLTNWARASRFAGSGDRHAVRDLVFDAIRCRRSFAAYGGAETGRGLIIGGLRANGADPDALFDGQGHAPTRLTETERRAMRTEAEMTEAEALDCPDWLIGDLKASLGDDFVPVMRALQQRAPVFLRVNLARQSRAGVMKDLAGEGITTEVSPLADTALLVTANARKIAASRAYSDGLVELQDAASQAVIQALPLRDGLRVLDMCAGGGGKTLAMAARARLDLTAHDAIPARLRDLPPRAARAGIKVRLAETAALPASAPFDLVLTDVPCSGSGAWRRSPEGKWLLTTERLQATCRLQAEILDQAAPLVRQGGTLAYVTCSLLDAENTAQITGFLGRHSDFQLMRTLRMTPVDGGDGFFLALLERRA